MSKGARVSSGTRMDVMQGGRFGITQRTVWRPESGYHDARTGTITNFAQVLDVKRGNTSRRSYKEIEIDSRHRTHPRRRDR
jgi:hypothetical protein